MRVESEADMLELGARVARSAAPGMVLRLIGPLGAGKTTFARGFLRGLGFEEDVRSPTFGLIHEYPTKPPVCHVDLFRLNGPRQAYELGITDYLATHAVLIEWAERAEGLLPEDAATIRFEIADGARELAFEGLSL